MTYWVLLGCALLLVGTLLVLLITGVLGSDTPAPPDEEFGNGASRPRPGAFPLPVPPRRRLPAAREGDARDRDPPTWLDGVGEDVRGAFDDGVFLLVFADIGEGPGAEKPDGVMTLRSSDGIHRRMRDLGARLVIVVPRQAFLEGSGRLARTAERVRYLRTFGVSSDVTIYLDAPDASSFGGALRASYRVTRPNAAVVVVDGRLEHRLTPVEGGLSTDALEPIAVRASEIRPAVRTGPGVEGE